MILFFEQWKEIIVLSLFIVIQLRLVGDLRSIPVNRTGTSGEFLEKINSRLVQTLTFGHLPVLIDTIWMKTLIEDPLNKVEPGTHGRLFYHIDLISDLDPKFYEAYVIGGNFLSVVQKDGIGSEIVLSKGNRFIKAELAGYEKGFRDRFWPDPWRVPVALGYNYLFDLDDLPSATNAFLEAAAIPGSPAFLGSLKNKLNRPGGQYEVGLNVVNLLIAGAKDEKVKKMLEHKRQNLVISKFLFELNQLHDQSDSAPMNEKELPKFDPWGGQIYKDGSGKWTTTTPYETEFNLKPY